MTGAQDGRRLARADATVLRPAPDLLTALKARRRSNADDPLDALVGVQTVRPIHRPDEVWTRCPSCERTGPNRLRLTLRSAGGALDVSCRHGCSPVQIHACLRGDRDGERHGKTARERPPQARDMNRTSPRRHESARGWIAGPLSPSDTGSTSLSREDLLSTEADNPEPGHQGIAAHALGYDVEAVKAALRFLEVDVSQPKFPCPVPGHGGRAWLYRHAEQYAIKIACWCVSGTRRPDHWSPGDIRAFRAYQTPRELSRIERAIWLRRLFHESGQLTAADIKLPLLPNATVAHERVRGGFALLVGLRWIDFHGQPVTYGKSFAAVWAGVAASTAAIALARMKQHGVITDAGRTDNGTKLYLPGEVA